jgi:hypothetical protein
MASPDFHAVNFQELKDSVDVCIRCFADQSEEKIDLIPGGKQFSKIRDAGLFQRK